jgi:hypothetical protein
MISQDSEKLDHNISASAILNKIIAHFEIREKLRNRLKLYKYIDTSILQILYNQLVSNKQLENDEIYQFKNTHYYFYDHILAYRLNDKIYFFNNQPGGIYYTGNWIEVKTLYKNNKIYELYFIYFFIISLFLFFIFCK